MPKLIADIEQNIFDAAFKLFSNKRYHQVNMKAIAQKAGIAVGTLYNYHQSKENLYISILHYHLNKTFQKLHQIPNNNKDFSNFIALYYDEIAYLRLFYQELVENKHPQAKISEIKKEFRANLTAYLKKTFFTANLDTATETRILRALLLLSLDLINEFPDTRQENIEFLTTIIDAAINAKPINC